MEDAAATLIPTKKRESLISWFNLYLGIEGRAGSDNTFLAKKRDLETFLNFLVTSAGTDHPDQWTRSVTRDFLKHLERKLQRSPTTVNECSPPSACPPGYTGSTRRAALRSHPGPRA
jgi:hypothetical protein